VDIIDLVSVGQSSGEAVLFRLSNTGSNPIPLAVKQQRSCNSVSFSSNGMFLATGLDKVRSDFCLNIWDVNQRLGHDNARPTRQLASSEAITSCRFTRDNPMTLVAGVSYRWVKMFDLRESPSNPAISCNSRCVNSLSLDFDPNYFAGYSDEGAVTIWDRRYARNNPGGEPALVFNRAMDDIKLNNARITHLRHSSTREGVFAVLNDWGALRVYETAKISNHEPFVPASIGIIDSDNGITDHKPRTSGWRDSAASLLEAGRGAYGGGTSTSGSRTPNPRNDGETLFVNRINDLEVPRKGGKVDNKITCFDWIHEGRRGSSGRLKILAFKGDGSIEVLSCPISVPNISWGCRNQFAVTYGNDLQVMKSSTIEPIDNGARPRRKSIYDADLDEKYQLHGSRNTELRLGMLEKRSNERSNSIVRMEDFLLDPKEVLKNDMCMVMRKRVEAGYLMNCARNATLAAKENQYLEEMWIWLDGAVECAKDGGMMASTLDLSFLGVMAVWYGGKDLTPESRVITEKRPLKDDWTAACQEVNMRFNRKKFDFCSTEFPDQRRLCLAICGCNYTAAELEQELVVLVLPSSPTISDSTHSFTVLKTVENTVKPQGWHFFMGR
jgi:WD40 repeat protein